MKLFILSLTTLFFMLNCTKTMQIEDFSKSKPPLILQTYFNGSLKAYGMVKDRGGNIIRRFRGKLIGSWNKEGIGTLDETFIYDDNETQHRIWTFTPTSQTTFDATANDIVGTAKGITQGNSVMLDYTMRIPYNHSTIDIDVKDWLHLQEDGVILNHSKMKKFGFEVGELVITIIKE